MEVRDLGKFFNEKLQRLKVIPGRKTVEQMRKEWNREQAVNSQKETESRPLPADGGNTGQPGIAVLPARKRGRKRKTNRLQPTR